MTSEIHQRRGELPHDVYWLYDAEGRVLYIGCTVELETRLHAHQNLKEWFPKVARVETESFPNRDGARAREDEALLAERPMFNKKLPKPPTSLPPIIRRGEPLKAVENFAGQRSEASAS